MTAVTDTAKFKIVTVPADGDGCRFYLEQYKPFRLASLQKDAQGTSHVDRRTTQHIAYLR